ncbi:MAG: 50S ribosomal protein L3 [Thermoplasmata archaeon]
MGKRHKPRRGSMGFSPRKRAKSVVPSFSSWPTTSGKPKMLGFVGYKVGMTHVMVKDTRKRSTTENQEIVVPTTVIEVPPVKVVGIRLYKRSVYGIEPETEVWMDNIDNNMKELHRKISMKKKVDNKQEKKEKTDSKEKNKEKITLEKLENDISIEEVRVIIATQPYLTSGLPSKKPQIMEIPIGGGTIKERLQYAFSLLGKDVKATQFLESLKIVDISAITKGKGFQGHIKRWGVKLQPRKNSKHIRMIGTLGPHNPSYIMPTVPQSGQMGFHQRTEYNKMVLAYIQSNNIFTMGISLKKDLESKELSDDIKKYFSDNGNGLSKSAVVKAISGSEWQIIDEKRLYNIKEINNKLYVSILNTEEPKKEKTSDESKKENTEKKEVPGWQKHSLNIWQIIPKGGFLKYGLIKNDAILLKGSVPGTPKRLVRLRDPIRARAWKSVPEMPILYVSNTSKQGA